MRREDLENLTFGDEEFDLTITQDVLEHLLDPSAAVKEISRTLKKGGAHLFTVPVNRAIKSSERAVRRLGAIELLKPPVYHADPFDQEGSLVCTDWGADLSKIIEQHSGMNTEVISLNDPSNGTDAEMADVFISYKRST
jgi:ubiquinone/menaquinone biosynthesis C-methylase UbiE